MTVRSLHFIGICGTAMASTAAALRERGYGVTGSDENAYPPMSDFLAARGIPVQTPFAETNLDPRPDLIVVGNAISRGNPEVEALLERRLRHCSLPELLKEFFLRERRCLVVAGTHGKTTTTSLLAWVFEHAGRHPGYLIGGLPRNLGQGARFTDSEWFIIEGDEYDTAFFDKRGKFVHYQPEVAILNNLEYDHADIFPNLAAIQNSFRHFIRLVPRNGLILANGDDPHLRPLLDFPHSPIRRFGLGEVNDLRATDVELRGDGTAFTLGNARFRTPLVGRFNALNALAVAACARHCGLSDAEIQGGFDSFLGVARRMEVRGEAGGVTVIDDFGHHHTAIRETLAGLRLRWPDRRLWAVFEPRTNTTRRNVFQNELATAFTDADAVVIAAVARLEQLDPAERLDPERLLRDLEAAGKRAAYLPGVEAIVEHVARQARTGDVVVVFSNGGFGNIHRKLLDRLGGGRPPSAI
ncbi:MAG: UDP-N-acetylmuramate:L-alanyl-gamma-D-glutamyl-meso-diaminopimelate ligase [Verrucomicrobiales bacterium]|nr:UDP-N-acetylmuramate:L-alanyl-gamma-D-glutamyl-meso-diaminopimelate ligase [Verrucomicrobiales bacterium]MCP5526764.1 UDP-N-acetylmuramate:L-alanyl-gamma-D-glutamyl-meso-diaminopimelate ligase [Verrucomicrobiales bacterium]